MKKSRGKARGGIIAAVGLLILSKLKWVLALLKFTKFGGTFVSLIISLGFWAVIYGWKFAVAIIYLIFVHEMGHLVAAKQKGIKTSPAIFIPFFGAFISMKEQPKDAATESYLAYGGPLAGLISIIPAFILFQLNHDEPFWALVIMLGALINLINLMPASPLDGGRIVGVLSPHLWLLGLVALAAYVFFYPSALLILIIIIGFFTWWGRFREDFTIKTIQTEISVKKELTARIEMYRDDLFYTFYNDEDEEGPPVNEAMRSFIKRELNNLGSEAKSQLKNMKSWFFPFVEDKAKLEKRRLQFLVEESYALANKLDQITDPGDLHDLINNEKTAMIDLQNRMEHINKYYNADPKTRIFVFFAYILLATVLGGCYLYAEHQLNDLYPYMYDRYR
ncbi:MAG: site-2 protease family protein [Tuberibacillus sp.]